jgi:hypothetical protein
VRLSQSLSWRVAIALLTVLVAVLGACADGTTAAAPTLAPTPDVTVSVTSVSLFVGAEERISVDVGIARSGGFTGPVTLSVSGLPADVTADLGANPVAGASAIVDIITGPGVRPGEYRFTLAASGSGVRGNTIAIDLHVVAPHPTNVTVAYCREAAPDWVAFQDGNGEWRRATPNVQGERTFFRRNFVTDRGGIATVSSSLGGALTVLSVLYGTPAELASAGDTSPIDCGGGVPKNLFGSVAGLGANESALISTGNILRVSVPTGRTTFHLTGLPSGPRDLLATRTTPLAGGSAVTGLLLRRNVDLPDSADVGTLDFTSAEGFAPATATVRVGGVFPAGAITGTRLRTSNSDLLLSNLTDAPTSTTRPYFALPESRLMPGDLQVLRVSTVGPSSDARDADLYFRSPIDRTLTLGAPLAAPAITAVSTSPSLRVRAKFEPQAEYDRSTSILYEQGASSALVVVSMTAGYAALGDGFDLIVPDLSRVAGFDPVWALIPGAQLLWSATRVGGTLGLGRDAVPSDGTDKRAAFRKDTITVR